MKFSLRSVITPAADTLRESKYLTDETNTGWGIKRGAFSTASRDVNDNVTHMPIARQRLGKHISEAYTLINTNTSIAR
jgi:hypothetical protein